jgi:hypothetical protein
MEFDQKRDRFRIVSRRDRVLLKLFEGDAPHLIAEVAIPRTELDAVLNVAAAEDTESEAEGRCMVVAYRWYT